MSDALKRVEALIATGKTLSYADDAIHEPQGRWLIGLKPRWITWRDRVIKLIDDHFEGSSGPASMVAMAYGIKLEGDGPTRFEKALSYYMGALEAAQEILTDDFYGELAKSGAKAAENYSKRVFVVHGHDDKAKAELEGLLVELGLDPVVLHRQPDGGKTLIEKFEHYADVGYAFILATPDEVAYLATEAQAADGDRQTELRARPNVIFEFGYFVGRLGRHRTCCIMRGNVAQPSDLNGLVYKKFAHSIDEVAYSIQKELKEAGYTLA